MFSFDNPGSPLKEGLQRQPPPLREITVQMKREKLQALRSDFVSAGRGTTPTSPGHRGATTVGTRAHQAFSSVHEG